jgi:predicted esterase
LLHGSGGDEYDLLETGRVVAPRDYMIASLRAPMARNYDRGISGRGAYR